MLDAPTQSILKIFSVELPNMFDLQNLVMDTAKEHNLQGPQVKALCMTIKDSASLEEATRIIRAINWESWESVYSRSKNKALRRAHDPRHKGRSVLINAERDVARTAERLDATVVRGEEVTPEMLDNLRDALSAAKALLRKVGDLSLSLSEGIAENSDREEEELPEVIIEDPEANMKRHLKWGLSFKVYEDEPAPTVIIDGKGQFDLDDVSSGILYAVSRKQVGQAFSVDQIQDLLQELGFDPRTVANSIAIRKSIHIISKRLTERGKPDHALTRDGRLRQVYFGLID